MTVNLCTPRDTDRKRVKLSCLQVMFAAAFAALMTMTGVAHAQYVIAVPTPETMRPLEYIAPEYPVSEWEAGHHGFLTATGTVQPDGTITDVAISESSGAPGMDDATLAALRQWRFTPVEAPTPYSVRFEFRRDTLSTLDQKTCAHLTADIAWFRERNPDTSIREMPLNHLSIGIFTVFAMREPGGVSAARLRRLTEAYEQTAAYCEDHPRELYLRRFQRIAGF